MLQDQEVGLLTEITHLQEIMDGLCLQADSPESLPTSSEQVIMDLKGLDTKAWSIQVWKYGCTAMHLIAIIGSY